METNRLKELYDALSERNIVKNKRDFSLKLGIQESNATRYINGDVKYIINDIGFYFFKENNISLEWYITGQGEMFTNSTGPAVDQTEKARVEELEREISKLKEQLDKISGAIAENASLKKSISDLEKENNELAKELLDKYRELVKIKDQHLGFST